MESAHVATVGPTAAGRVAVLQGRAAELAERIESPHAVGMVELVRGIGSVLFGRWKDARAALDRAEELLRNHCTGVAWERVTGNNFALYALFRMGEISELRRRWTLLSREAQERGDRYATIFLGSWYGTIVKLAGDERPDSEPEIEAFLGARGGRPLNLQHDFAFTSLMHIDLYRGDVTRAWTRLEALWPEYKRSLFLRIQLIRIQMLELRARTAVAAAERSQQPAPLLEMAGRDAQALEAEGQGWAIAHAHYIRAAIAACREDPLAAAQGLSRAAELYDRADMPLNAQVMRYRIGEIDSSEEAIELRERAMDRFKEQGIASPVRWAALFAPGFARISNDSIETTF
jgi:hypothetical protein